MKKIGLLLFFAVFACSLSAQNRLSVFIGNANRYASVDLSDFCRRLCVEYDISAESLNNYYGVAAEIGGMWALRWRSPEPRDEACAISVIITDVIRVRAGGGF